MSDQTYNARMASTLAWLESLPGDVMKQSPGGDAEFWTEFRTELDYTISVIVHDQDEREERIGYFYQDELVITAQASPMRTAGMIACAARIDAMMAEACRIHTLHFRSSVVPMGCPGGHGLASSRNVYTPQSPN